MLFVILVTSAITEGGDSTDSSQHNYVLSLLDGIMKGNNIKSVDAEEVIDLSSPANIVGIRVNGTSLIEVRQCVEKCETNGNWTPIKLLIEEVFTSLTALANSFPNEGKRTDVEMLPLTATSTSAPHCNSGCMYL